MNTPHSTTKATKTPPSQRKASKHKTAKTNGHLAPEPLLQANPNRFVLFPIQHDDIWRMCTKRPKRPFGLPRRLTSLLILQTGTDSRQWCSTSYPTSWLFLRHLMALSMKILAATLPQRSRYLKPDASMAFRLPSRTSIAKHTHS